VFGAALLMQLTTVLLLAMIKLMLDILKYFYKAVKVLLVAIYKVVRGLFSVVWAVATLPVSLLSKLSKPKEEEEA